MNNKCGHFNIVYNCENCNSLKQKWDEKLQSTGFEDVEKNGIIQKWSGAKIKVIHFATPQSQWPEIKFQIEEEFFNHPDFEKICDSLCKHGNHTLTGPKIMAIWEAYCEGLSLRKIEKKYKVHNVTAYRIIKKLREMSKLCK